MRIGLKSAVAALMLSCLSLAAAAATQVAGTVRDEAGKPVAGARVALFYDHDGTGYGAVVLAETKTAANGGFKLESRAFAPPATALGEQAPQALVVVTATGYAVAAEPVIPERAKDVAIRLVAPAPLACRITDGAKPIAGVQIALAAIVVPDPRSPDGARSLSLLGAGVPGVSSDKDGAAKLDNVPAGDVVVAVRADGFAPAVMELKKDTRTVTIGLARQRLLQGVVKKKEDNMPLAAMVVALQPLRPGADAWTVTDAQGRYSLILDPASSSCLAFDPRPEPTLAPGWVQINRPEGDAAITADLEMSAGFPVHGTVVRPGDNTPMEQATVQLRGGPGNVAVFARTDAKGVYRAAVMGGWVSAQVMPFVPKGSILVAAPPKPKWVWVTGPREVPAVELDVRAAVDASFTVLDPAGKPAAGATLAVRLGDGPLWTATTDERGGARVSDVPRGATLAVHGLAKDLKAAGMRRATIPEASPVDTIELRLQPSRTAAVVTTDANRWPMPSEVEVWAVAAPDEGAGDRLLVARVKSEGDVLVHGLLPGVQYDVLAKVNNANVDIQGARERRASLKFAVDDKNPTVAVQFDARQTSRPWTLQPYVDIEKQVATLGKVRWSRKDTVDPALTWVAFEGGLAMADRSRGQLQRFVGFFGYGRIQANAIAFGKERAWLGTDAGLFAWHRADRYWSRYAVNAAMLEVPVTDVAVDAGGILHVVVEPKAGESRTFLFNPEANRWSVPAAKK